MKNIFFQFIIVSLLIFNINSWSQSYDFTPSKGSSLTLQSIQPVFASSRGAFRVRGGVGTDINLGLGFGGGFAYAWIPTRGSTSFELGADIYYGTNDEETVESDATYNEETKLLVFSVRANGLFNYSVKKTAVYFIVGFGFVVADVEWKETRTANGQTNPYDDADGTSAGNIINLGAGITFGKSGLEARLETPMLYFYSQQGNAAAFAPTFTFTLLYRF